MCCPHPWRAGEPTSSEAQLERLQVCVSARLSIFQRCSYIQHYHSVLISIPEKQGSKDASKPEPLKTAGQTGDTMICKSKRTDLAAQLVQCCKGIVNKDPLPMRVLCLCVVMLNCLLCNLLNINLILG